MPQQPRHVIVDGSNIATEGRSMPSLAQLDEAVRAFMAEFPDAQITVVVDATFGHRIPAEEVPAFDEAVANAEIVSPPAGAFGRGDAFLLRIAEKVDADVLSNDSFQEFHGEHEWLFDRGRLIGGKPVPGIGWIFTARSPVRGPKSREAVRRARSSVVDQAIKTATDEATSRGGRRRRSKATDKGPVEPKVGDARIAPLSAEELAQQEEKRRRRRGQVPSDPVNEPMVFLGFVASNRPGSTVDGTVEEFTSHGAFVRVGEARCYLPLAAMGDPPPRAARDVVNKGETRPFTVQAFDTSRRGIELAIPEFAHLSGAPSDETVEQEIKAAGTRTKKAATKKAAAKKEPAVKKAPAKRGAKKAAAASVQDLGVVAVAEEPVTLPEPGAPVKKKATGKKTAAAKKEAAPKKTATKKEAAPKKTATKKEAAPKKAATKKEAAAKKAAPKKTTAKKSAAKKTAAPPAE